MADIGKVTPGGPIITRVPRDRPATDDKEQHPEHDEEKNNENDEAEKENHNNNDKDGGIDFYV